ncbi:MAG: type II toxin-antitoxin system RelE/ParE family toxin [Oligoflexia bacterium]|nr:type II toxin-antitoxin system RelE/ParE family toxin [Oligoflexia bacterium]
MIKSFKDKHTEEFFRSGKVGPRLGWKTVANVAMRKLDMLDYAVELRDLKSPPGNFLEELKRELKGFCSIRINDQWRIIFRWTKEGPIDVAIVDYH